MLLGFHIFMNPRYVALKLPYFLYVSSDKLFFTLIASLRSIKRLSFVEYN